MGKYVGTNGHGFTPEGVDDPNRGGPTSSHVSYVSLKLIENNIAVYQHNPSLTTNIHGIFLFASKFRHSGTTPLRTSFTRKKIREQLN